MTITRFESIRTLFDHMDTAWDKIAAQYLFNCTGCADNCCQSLFFHHTHIESAYLRHGLDQLAPDKKQAILGRAKTYCEKTFDQTGAPKSLKLFCPANENGRCLVYDYRPMICRLHGLPHELTRPGFPPVRGPGCSAGKFNEKPYIKFDRTPFYQQMARIEIVFRRTAHKTGKIKQTIAQILVSPDDICS